MQIVGSTSPLRCCFRGRRYAAQTSISYRLGIFRLKRNGLLDWERLNLGSGFSVEITYARRVVVDGSVIGLTDDYDLTPPLARFLALNEEIIVGAGGLATLEHSIERYRHHLRRECWEKAETLSYRFLAFVYDRPRDPNGLAESSIEHERDPRVRRLLLTSEDVLRITYERLGVASRTTVTTWWYIFWVPDNLSIGL